MKLTQAQSKFIISEIVSDTNDNQVSDYYEFGNLQITWVQAQESYLVEENGTTSWCSPNDIVGYISDLSDELLLEWFINQYDCDDWFEECIEELMLEETE